MSDLRRKWEKISEEIEKTIEYKIESIAFDISVQIYRQMRKLGINKKELAEKLNVSKAYVTQLLKGKSNMTIETMVKIAEALNMTPKIELIPKSLKLYHKAVVESGLDFRPTSAVDENFSTKMPVKIETTNPTSDENQELAVIA